MSWKSTCHLGNAVPVRVPLKVGLVPEYHMQSPLIFAAEKNPVPNPISVPSLPFSHITN